MQSSAKGPGIEVGAQAFLLNPRPQLALKILRVFRWRKDFVDMHDLCNALSIRNLCRAHSDRRTTEKTAELIDAVIFPIDEEIISLFEMVGFNDEEIVRTISVILMGPSRAGLSAVFFIIVKAHTVFPNTWRFNHGFHA